MWSCSRRERTPISRSCGEAAGSKASPGAQPSLCEPYRPNWDKPISVLTPTAARPGPCSHAALICGAARRLAADEPGSVGLLVLRHPRQLRMHVERGLVAPRLDQKDAALIAQRQQHVELLAAV